MSNQAYNQITKARVYLHRPAVGSTATDSLVANRTVVKGSGTGRSVNTGAGNIGAGGSVNTEVGNIGAGGSVNTEVGNIGVGGSVNTGAGNIGAGAAVNKYFVGELEKRQSAAGATEYCFQYDVAYCCSLSVPIATSFPVRAEAYVSSTLHPFFDNLIVEGWLADYAEKQFHIDKKDRFALLMATGYHTFGAVSVEACGHKAPVHPAEALARPVQTYVDTLKLASKNQGAKNRTSKVWASKARPSKTRVSKNWAPEKIQVVLDAQDPWLSFARTIYGGSVSGYQKKGLFKWNHKKRSLIPTPKQADFILKPEGQLPELPANEHLSLLIAQKLQFDVTGFELIRLNNIGLVLVVQRFDRFNTQPLKMEELGQVLGFLSEYKYAHPYKTLSCEKVAAAIAQHVAAPKIDLYKFYRRMVFNYFIANGDMHLKNWALVENPLQLNTYKLAPCYDFINTRLVLPHETEDVCLSLNGKKNKLTPKDFKAFAERFDISSQPDVFGELANWWQVVQQCVPQSLLSPSYKERYLEIVEQRYRRLV